jgi:hypothetical protein
VDEILKEPLMAWIKWKWASRPRFNYKRLDIRQMKDDYYNALRIARAQKSKFNVHTVKRSMLKMNN